MAHIAALAEHASQTKARTQQVVEKVVEQRYSVGMVAATVAAVAITAVRLRNTTPATATDTDMSLSE